MLCAATQRCSHATTRWRHSGAYAIRFCKLGRTLLARCRNTSQARRVPARQTRSCFPSTRGVRFEILSSSASSAAQAPPDAVWSAQSTTPDAIEAALRGLVNQRHSENGGLVPARALNMVTFVDSGYSGEIANRLAAVGRYHASRLVLLPYDPHRTSLHPRAVVPSEGEPRSDEVRLIGEAGTVEIGEPHLDDLVTIVDPL